MSADRESALPQFRISSDPGTVAQRWLRNSELFTEEKAIVESARKRAALLRHAGEEVQDIAEDLERDQEAAEARAAAAAAQLPAPRQRRKRHTQDLSLS